MNDLVNLDQFTLNEDSKNQQSQKNLEHDQLSISSKLSDFLEDTLYVHIRERIIRILPQHWIDRIVRIITFQAGQYRGSDIAKMCQLNGNQFDSLGTILILRNRFWGIYKPRGHLRGRG